jgi:sugar diacid utilization regulator
VSAVVDIRHLDEVDRELVRCMAEESLKQQKVAQRMCLSFSTIQHRLRGIVVKTGVDPRTFFGLARLYYAVESAQRLRRR